MGAGRSELMRCVFGIDSRSEGKVIFKGKEVRKDSITASIKAGMCFLSEKRKEEGLHQDISIMHNLNMVIHAIANRPFISNRLEEDNCREMVERLNIKVGRAL